MFKSIPQIIFSERTICKTYNNHYISRAIIQQQINAQAYSSVCWQEEELCLLYSKKELPGNPPTHVQLEMMPSRSEAADTLGTLSLALALPHDVFVEGSGHRVGQLGSLQQGGHGDRQWRGQLVWMQSLKTPVKRPPKSHGKPFFPALLARRPSC